MSNSIMIQHQLKDDMSSSLLSDFAHEDDKKSMNDDIMTEEDTDTELEEDVVDKPFLNLPDTKYENKPEFHPYQTTNEEISYHPTFYDAQASSNSKHTQESTSPNALCPPSHALRARRLSKNAIQSSTSTPINSTPKTKVSRKHSFAESMGTNSAVSPRFMALRKLSEVSTLSSHHISYSSVPPVPQIPSIYQPSTENHSGNKSSSTDRDFENRIISRIDDVLETQLQFHLGQVAWKSSESYLDARQFWEAQKKEVFGLATTLIERLESHVETRKFDHSKEEELQSYKTKYRLQSELLETYKLRYEQQIKVMKSCKQQCLDASHADTQQQLEELKAKYANMEQQHQQDQDLLEQANEKIRMQVETIAQLKESNNRLVNESKLMRPVRSASITSELFRKKSTSTGTDWADIMESEDEAKKSAEEWAHKYRALQASYFEVCLKLEKNQTQSDDDLSQSITKKEDEIRYLKQAESASRAQVEQLQLELDKYRRQSAVRPKQQNKKSKQTANDRSSYVTEDGYLVFTTEINGRPSRYSIKIPNNCR